VITFRPRRPPGFLGGSGYDSWSFRRPDERFINAGAAVDFFNGGDAPERFFPGILAHGDHAVQTRCLRRAVALSFCMIMVRRLSLVISSS
jgi:hypothetical protein